MSGVGRVSVQDTVCRGVIACGVHGIGAGFVEGGLDISTSAAALLSQISMDTYRKPHVSRDEARDLHHCVSVIS